jgi:hypothetical protein
MRTSTALLALAILGLVFATALPAAFAEPPSGHRGASGDKAGRGPGGGDNATAKREAILAAKKASVESFNENRSRILSDYRAALNATRAAYLAAKASVIESCRADGPADGHANASKEDKLAWAKCVKDGLAPLKEKARAEMAALKEKAKSDLLALRAKAVERFHAEKARAARGAHA